jgi:formylglycine-generating enzyme required for sulfatase activity
VIAGPENIDVLVAVPDAPARLWWEKVGMELCLVPAGEFVMGSPDGTGDDNEHPQHRVYLHSYYIGRTPVTQQQYARFVMEMGGGAPCCDMDWAKPYNWDRARKTFPQGKAQHPVVLVSWHDAEAWCRWAGLRLPTEAEWEKAARGKDGRQYPWGERWEDGRCNSYESGKGGTTPMGTYSPAGDSPYGCADMAGNVLERTSSLYDPYPYDAGDGREDTATEGKRVLRGGSWYTQQEYVRSASRYGLEPTYWHLCTGGVGFRCSVSSTYSP